MMHYEVQQIINHLESVEADKFDAHAKVGLIQAIGVLASEIARLNDDTVYRLCGDIRESCLGIAQVLLEKGGK